MNLLWLQTFNAIVDKGSLTEAAHTLNLTQPAVSKQLRSLEDYYGAQLLYRTTRAVELTEAGKAVYRYSLRALDLIGKSRQEVDSLAHNGSGEIKLGASTIPGEYLLPRYLEHFHQRYPGIRVKMEIGDSREITSQVAEGKLELGAVGSIFKNRGLRFEHFYRDRMVVIAPSRHPLAGQSEITPEELAAQPLVAREIGSGTRKSLEEKLAAAGVNLSRLQISLELGSTTAVISAVSRGAGLSLVSELAVREQAAAGALHTLTLKDLTLERGLYFVTRKSCPLTTSLTTLLNFLKETIRQD